MKQVSKIPTLFGVILLVLGVGVGVLLVNREQIFKLGASPQTTPKDVKITNISDTSLAVSWITDEETNGFVKWGETANLGQVKNELSQASSRVHFIRVDGLRSGKTYYIKVNSQGSDFDNNGVPWTGTTLSVSQGADVTRVSGTILDEAGVPVTSALVHISSQNMTTQTAQTSTGGSFIMALPLSPAQTGELLEVYVQGGKLGISTAQVYVRSANPIPPMQLGKTYDLRSLTESTAEPTLDEFINALTISQSQQGATQQSTGASKFDTTTKTGTASQTVTLKSIKEGEVIYTTKPEFFGDAPPNTPISIKINSTQSISKNVVASSDGSWKYSPAQSLDDGAHTVTLSWKDSSGILKTITRSFVVQAASNEPSFVSTPSAFSPSPKPTPTPTKTASPSATPRLTPTAKPATQSALPNAGATEVSIAFLAFGMGLLTLGFYVSKKSVI